jgi:hypothetical protein
MGSAQSPIATRSSIDPGLETESGDTFGISLELVAAIIAVHNNEPRLLLVRPSGENDGPETALPFGNYSPIDHVTLEAGLRSIVCQQTGIELSASEQLYTFSDTRADVADDVARRYGVCVGYVAFVRPSQTSRAGDGKWCCWYDYLPWEDWRQGKPKILIDDVEPRLRMWATQPSPQTTPALQEHRNESIDIAFGLGGVSWDEEKVLQRFELMVEAGLIGEAGRDSSNVMGERVPQLGLTMFANHRRILAMAIGRLRGALKSRPVVFELMAEEFTLFELQKTVEAILGPHLHKQNFRRLVESMGLVEPTGDVRAHTGGRPAKLYRFRHNVLLEKPAPGVRVKAGVA